MAWESYMGCVSDLELKNCRGATSSTGAHNLFDEIPTSELEEWREPTRVLEVSIRWAYYPITEEILYQIFGSSAVVEEVFLCKELELVEARVLFPSRLEVAEAFGKFHCRNIYDGCCQMIIKWGIFRECATSANMTFGNTMIRSSSYKLLQAHVVSTVAMESTFNPTSAATELSYIDIEPNNFNSGASFNCSTNCLSCVDEGPAFDEGPVFREVSVFDEESNNVITPLSCLTKCPSLITNVMESAAVCTISEEIVVDVVSAATASMAGDVVSNGNIEAATDFSIERPKFGSSALALMGVSGIVHVSMAWSTYTQVAVNIQCPSTLNQTSLINDSLDGHEVFTKGNFTVSIFGNISTTSSLPRVINYVVGDSLDVLLLEEWQPWPELLEIMHNSVEILRVPWWSFITGDDYSVFWDFCWLWKPPWPLLACLQTRWQPIDYREPDQQGIRVRRGVVVVLPSNLIWLTENKMVLSKEMIELAIGSSLILIHAGKSGVNLIPVPCPYFNTWKCFASCLLKHEHQGDNMINQAIMFKQQKHGSIIEVFSSMKMFKLSQYNQSSREIRMKGMCSGDCFFRSISEDATLRMETMVIKFCPSAPIDGIVHKKTYHTNGERSWQNTGELQIPWDPGGVQILHRLEGKSDFKKGRMLGTIALAHGAVRPKFKPKVNIIQQVKRRGIGGDEGYRRLYRN